MNHLTPIIESVLAEGMLARADNSPTAPTVMELAARVTQAIEPVIQHRVRSAYGRGVQGRPYEAEP